MGLTQLIKLVIVPGKRAFNYAHLVAINVFISCHNYENVKQVLAMKKTQDS